VLKTKLYIPPVRPGLVSRPRLIERLEERLHLGCKLTLVSAPAGFGKTTLVTEWLRSAERSFTPGPLAQARVGWLSLDEGDNDPIRFWTYLIAAIQAVHPEVGDEARQIVGSPPFRSAEWVVVSLLNEIAELSRDLILVLDDYHAIQAEQIHGGLDYLLEHQPPNLHLVLIARVDPPLPLARLRAHGQLIEIRAVDLEFSADEAATLFDDVMNLQLKPEQVAALHLRTEGWIVGLQLAALSLRGHPAYDTFIEHFTGSQQVILDYLTEEVLRALPDAQRQFLLRTAILDRFCGALCEAVTGNAASLQMLDEIRRGNLFLIPLDMGGRWFRYHHLFAEVLRALLERDHPDKVAALHLKAAVWFEDQGYAGEAVDHALRSGDTQRTKALVLEHWPSMLHRGEVATLLRWLDALPEEIERDDPTLSLARCWALFLSGQAAAIEPHLKWADDACERLVSEGTLDGAPQRLVAAQLAMMRSVLARGLGKHAESVSHAEEAVRLVTPAMLEGAGTAWNMLGAARAGAGDYDGAIEAHGRGGELVFGAGNLAGAYMCTYGRAMYLIVQGRLNEADESCRSAIERGLHEGHGDLPVAGWPHVAMARIELERYRLEVAQAYLDDGLRIARPGGQGELLRAGRYLCAHLAAARGNQDGAVEILQDTERIIDAMDDPYLTGELAWQWATVCLNTGDLHGARTKLADLDKMCTATRHANLLIARDQLTARLLWAEGRYDEALAELAEAIARVRASNSTGQLVRLLAVQAVALAATGKREPARAVLREGLALGARGGYIRRWLDAGPSIAPLLRDVRDEGNTPQALHPYLDALLDACRSAFGDAALQPARQLAGDMLDPLTARELEVVRLICAGHSGPEIAKELVLAYNTVRKHISNIYSKLGVRSRTQAIARVQELNLL
jgi:LuxR family maltose regulon positive regulatory protein